MSEPLTTEDPKLARGRLCSQGKAKHEPRQQAAALVCRNCGKHLCPRDSECLVCRERRGRDRADGQVSLFGPEFDASRRPAPKKSLEQEVQQRLARYEEEARAGDAMAAQQVALAHLLEKPLAKKS